MKILIKLVVRFLCWAVAGLLFAIILVKILNPSLYHQGVGDLGRKHGYYSFAVERYSRAIHLNASSAGAFNSRGVTRYYQGQLELAAEDYNRAIELDPQYALAIKNRALVLLALGKAEEAKRDYTLACILECCEDFTRRCSELKLRCETGECTSLQTAVKAGLCPEQ